MGKVEHLRSKITNKDNWAIPEQGKKLFFHFTRPSDNCFPDFGCPNTKSTCPKNDPNVLLVNLLPKQ